MHSLFAVCQPETPRNHHLRPIEVKPLIRNNRASEREGIIRETEAGVGDEGGKDVSFTSQIDPLLSPPARPISPAFSGDQGGWLWGGGGAGEVSRGAIPVPGGHAPLGHSTRQLWEAWQGGKREGRFWRCPVPGAGVSWIRAGGAAQAPQAHPPASSTSKMLSGLGSCRLLVEETQPSPRRGVPSASLFSLIKVPSKGEGSPQPVLV